MPVRLYTLHAIFAAFTLILASGCGPRSTETKPPGTSAEENTSASAGPPWFEDVTLHSGIDFTYRNGEEADQFTILETLGGGVGLIDFDRDGLLDVLLPGGGGFEGPEKNQLFGLPTKLFRNLGQWRFEDVTDAVGLNDTSFYTHGCAVGDYDRDGWPDVLITGYPRLELYHNESDGNGGRRFALVTEAAGFREHLWSTSAAWGDVNGDGYPDLFVARYVDWSFENHPVCKYKSAPGDGRDACGPEKFASLPDSLYLNEQDGTFVDSSQLLVNKQEGASLGVILSDLDANGQPDIYVANDANPNHLYINDSGRFEERGDLAGVALSEDGGVDGSMGVDVGDFDGSGRPAIWVTNYQNQLSALYANLGNGLFRHQSKAAGLGALGRKLVSFGTGLVDVDHDGWEDLVFVSGHVLRYPSGSTYRQRAKLLQNVPRQKLRFFEDVSSQGGEYFQRELVGRGLAIGDLDNDGWPDLVVSHTNSPVVLLRNQAHQTFKHSWLCIELVGRDHRDIVGTTVELDLGDRKLTRFVKGGGSYLSANDPRLFFGLGPSPKIGPLTVRWSWGESQKVEGLALNGRYRIIEGESKTVRF